MIRLGTLDLPDDLLCPTDYGHQSMSASVDMAVDGTEVTFMQRQYAGRKIDLEAGEMYAWLTRAQADALHAMSEAGSDLLLRLHGQEITVRFRYEDGALDIKPVVSRPEYDDFDYFYGKIRLKEL